MNRFFRVYASALTTILLDTHNHIPTTDKPSAAPHHPRLQIPAWCPGDHPRWPSVRAGENKWIFPYQENADAMFNTAMIYELSVIKTQAEPLRVGARKIVRSMLRPTVCKFLKYFVPIPFRSLPPTSRFCASSSAAARSNIDVYFIALLLIGVVIQICKYIGSLDDSVLAGLC